MVSDPCAFSYMPFFARVGIRTPPPKMEKKMFFSDAYEFFSSLKFSENLNPKKLQNFCAQISISLLLEEAQRLGKVLYSATIQFNILNFIFWLAFISIIVYFALSLSKTLFKREAKKLCSSHLISRKALWNSIQFFRFCQSGKFLGSSVKSIRQLILLPLDSELPPHLLKLLAARRRREADLVFIRPREDRDSLQEDADGQPEGEDLGEQENQEEEMEMAETTKRERRHSFPNVSPEILKELIAKTLVEKWLCYPPDAKVAVHHAEFPLFPDYAGSRRFSNLSSPGLDVSSLSKGLFTFQRTAPSPFFDLSAMDLPSEVDSNLFVGDSHLHFSYQVVSLLNISHVVLIGQDPQDPSSFPPCNIHHLSPWADFKKEGRDLAKLIKIDSYKDVKTPSYRFLLLSPGGISEAPLLAISAMLHGYKISLLRAYASVLVARPQIFPSERGLLSLLEPSCGGGVISEVWELRRCLCEPVSPISLELKLGEHLLIEPGEQVEGEGRGVLTKMQHFEDLKGEVKAAPSLARVGTEEFVKVLSHKDVHQLIMSEEGQVPEGDDGKKVKNEGCTKDDRGHVKKVGVTFNTIETARHTYGVPECKFDVRGASYLKTRSKCTSAPFMLHLLGFDFFSLPSSVPGDCSFSHPSSLSYKLLHCNSDSFDLLLPASLRRAFQDSQDSERVDDEAALPDRLFVVNFRLGTKQAIVVFGCNSREQDERAPEWPLFERFMEGDLDRHRKFKMLPRVVEGPWVVQKTVGGSPTILPQKLTTTWHAGEVGGRKWLEADVDVFSSMIARHIIGVIEGACQKIVIDLAFLVEGSTPEELPERLLGGVRLRRIDLSNPRKEGERAE